MRIRLLGLCVLLLSSLAIAGCTVTSGSGQIVTEDRPISEVSKVELSDIGRLEISQGSPAKLTVQADDNLMKYIRTEVRGDTLIISVRQSGIPAAIVRPSKTPVYSLQLPQPTTIGVSGSGEVAAANLDVPSLTLDISGSGKTDLTGLKTQDFTYRLSGSGKADISGEITNEDVNISGSGRLTAGDLKAMAVSLNISGSGDATVWAVDSLNVNISGSGTVRYWGSPSITQQVSGSGNLKSLGSK